MITSTSPIPVSGRAVSPRLDPAAPASPPAGETYRRETYTLRRFEIVAPAVRNDGQPSGYADALRRYLPTGGVTGWTETETVGYWHGAREAGTTFIIYSADTRDIGSAGRPQIVRTLDMLAATARAAMPDQVAIQVVAGEIVTLREA